MERYRASGLKQQEFIVREGMSKASLGKWLKGERGEAAAKFNQPRFHELLLAQTPVTPWQMEIVSPKNWTLSFVARIETRVADRLSLV
ncbi:MAG TPA: hypothetical protein VHH88_08905 [Verrucomicrobiae bacterium]|nr:hypothetical protein [Verrucomicrobiae bacterium]